MQSNAVDRRETNHARDDVLQFLQFAVQRLVSLDDLFAEIVEHLPFAREAELSFAALDERGLERAFKRTDLLADCGLCDVVDLRSFGKTFCFGQIAKHFETFDLHGEFLQLTKI
jgi:hypothetical protein